MEWGACAEWDAEWDRRAPDLVRCIVSVGLGGKAFHDTGGRLAKLLGSEFSGATVAKLKDALVESLKRFKHEPLKDEYVAIVIDP